MDTGDRDENIFFVLFDTTLVFLKQLLNLSFRFFD